MIWFARLKHSRAVATQYDKRARNHGIPAGLFDAKVKNLSLLTNAPRRL
jgi:hypothetical protein